MAITQTSTYTYDRRIQYKADYIRSGRRRRIYDQFATPISEDSPAARAAERMSMRKLSQGGTIRLNYLADMNIGTTSLSEVTDITPQVLADNVIDVTSDMYGEALQISQKALIENYTGLGQEYVFKIGLNAMESIDNLALNAALNGNLVDRYVARASMDAGTTTHNATNDDFWYIQGRLQGFNVPQLQDDSIGPAWMCLTDPYVVHDVVTTADIVNVAQYQKGAMLLNHELGKLGPFRIISTGFSKIFLGVGLANDTDIDTTLSSAATALDTTIVVASGTSIAANQWLNITEAKETGSTFYPHNERVKVSSVSGTTVTITGAGDNGGLRFDHASGATVDRDDSVHTMLFGSPASLVKVWAPSIGQYGDIVAKQQGLANQWDSLAWKFWGGYGRAAEKLLYRKECTVLEETV
jgi:N4-gp56 family major capsid protein